jgi:diketogulonate reductase-like aldo/keto reductase
MRSSGHTAVNQLECHPLVMSHLDGLLKFHKAEAIQTSSVGIMTPILSGKGSRLNPVIERIANEHSARTGKEISTGAVLAVRSNTAHCLWLISCSCGRKRWATLL